MRRALCGLVAWWGVACGRVSFEPVSTDDGGGGGGSDGVITTDVSLQPCSFGSLVGHWRFDEIGGTVASDSTGNGNDGALMNMDPATDWMPGMIGNGLDFDGVDDRVVVPASPTLAGLGPGTWAFWLRLRTLDGTLVYKSDDNGAEGWWVDVIAAEGGLGFAGVFDGSNHRRYTNMYTIGGWAHFAITWDGLQTGTLIYVGGVAVPIDGTDSAGEGTRQSDATRNMVIGTGSTGSNEDLDGTLDELRIYNRVLSPAEIVQLPSCP